MDVGWAAREIPPDKVQGPGRTLGRTHSFIKRFGYIRDSLGFLELLDKTDEDLFSNMCRSQHCLHHLLPPHHSVDNLREHGHSFSLPDYNTNTYKKSFVLCSLYHFI